MKAMVVEDSRLAREGLMAMLAAYGDITLIGGASHPDAALKLLKTEIADVLFLDIHMPGRTGFDLLESLNYSPLVIFTTAWSEHAIRSFDFNTIDYLLKPISRKRLDQAVSKLRHRYALLASASESGVPTDAEPPGLNEGVLDIDSRMFIRDNGRFHLVDLRSIRYIESCKNYARLHFGEHRAFIKRPLSALEKRLPVKYFFRANRQYIVNLEAVSGVEEKGRAGCCLVFDDGKRVELSRRNRARLRSQPGF